MAVGNRRPVVMDKIDRMLWNVLLCTVHAPDDLPSLLQAALENINMDELRNLDEHELNLFQPGKPVNAGVPLINNVARK
jgi:hypothetical protein